MKISFTVLVIVAVALAKSTTFSTTKVDSQAGWVQPRFRASSGTTTVAYDDEKEESTTRDFHDTEKEAKEMYKLRQGIIQIEGDIVRKMGDLQSSIQWDNAVKAVILDFKSKVAGVKQSIVTKKTKLKTMLKKKRQLENLLLQIELKQKLVEAKDDMANLKTALHGVSKKKSKFNSNMEEVEDVVKNLTEQLKTLNGGALPEGALGTNGTDSTSGTDSASASGSDSGSGSF